jgi:hypothetical protein
MCSRVSHTDGNLILGSERLPRAGLRNANEELQFEVIGHVVGDEEVVCVHMWAEQES